MPIDIVTDQTSAHDPLAATCPRASRSRTGTSAPREARGVHRPARGRRWPGTSRPWSSFQDAGAEVFDYGNSIRDEARWRVRRAFEFPGFVPAYIRPLFCEGKGPFRWVALSGDAKDIAVTDRAVLELFPDNDRLHSGSAVRRSRSPSRGCRRGSAGSATASATRPGCAVNELVASARSPRPSSSAATTSTPVPWRALPRDRGDADGSDAIADWPLLNALVNVASGASWVSIHHGGGVGIGRSIHAGQVSVADGTELAAEKLARVLTNDPGMGVIRHVDAGYERAEQVARERGVRVPMKE